MCGLSFSIERYYQSETDRDFRSSDRDDEKDKYLAVEVVGEPGKCHEGQIRRVQHQFDAHVNHEQVPPHDGTQKPDGEQQRANGQIVLEGYVHARFFKQTVEQGFSFQILFAEQNYPNHCDEQ